MSALAYERVYLNASNPSNATTTTVDVNTAKWASGGATFGIHIDCKKLGIAEIASTTLWVHTNSGSVSMKLADAISLKDSVDTTVPSTTGSPVSFVFTTPIWCKDGTAVLYRLTYATTPVVVGFPAGAKSGAQLGGGAYAFNMGGSNAMAINNGSEDPISRAPAMWIDGTYATSTGGGGNSTTTYNFYTATTSTAEAIEQMTTVHLSFALLIVLFFTTIITYTFSYGRSRPT